MAPVVDSERASSLNGMRYTSTRNGDKDYSYRHTVYNSYAQDGGMFVPKEIPRLDEKTLDKLSRFSYADLFYEIAAMFIPTEDIPRESLRGLVTKSFESGGYFDCPEVVRLHALDSRVHIAELYHGKSWTFKDLAMTFLSNVLNYFNNIEQRHCEVVVVTSGDTGSAAMEAVRGIDTMNIHVLFPEGHCSPVQVQMMTSVLDDNVYVYSCGHDLPILDVAFQSLCENTSIKELYNVMTVNSQSWTRILSQIVHYFFAYFSVCNSVGQTVNIHVPSGGFGNITAGLFGKAMGLPIRLIMACNQNGMGDCILNDGKLPVMRATKHSFSCAIDIVLPMNIERIIYHASDNDVSYVRSTVSAWYQATAGSPDVKLKDGVTAKMRQLFTSATVSEDDVLAVMKRCHQNNDYIVDPHTAVALATAWDMKRFGIDDTASFPSVCLATASPEKFPEALTAAGIPVVATNRTKALWDMPSRHLTIDASQNVAETLIRRFAELRSKKP